MRYYSKMIISNAVTKDPKKIELFNKVASYISEAKSEETFSDKALNDEDNWLSKEAKEIIRKVRDKTDMFKYGDSTYMFYRLDEDGFIVCPNEIEEEIDGHRAYSGEHYAHELLALLISLVADNRVFIRLIGEDDDYDTWGYAIDSPEMGYIIDPAKEEKIIKLEPKFVYIDKNKILHYVNYDGTEQLFRPIKS